MGAPDGRGRHDDRLHVLSGALRAFAEATTDYERLLGVVARTVSDVVADGCIVRLLSDGGWLTPVAFHLPFEARGTDADAVARAHAFMTAPRNVAEYAWGQRLIETGETFILPVLDMPHFRTVVTPDVAKVYETIGIHSMLVVVLRLRGESIGTLTLFRFDPASPSFDDDDRDMAQALADHAALGIGNARSYAAEREARAVAEASEARYRLMFDNSPLPKWMYDVETLRFLDVNEATVRDYGYSRDEFLAMTIKDIRPPEDVPALLEAERRADLLPKFGVWGLRKKSGEVIQVELTKHTFTLGNRATRLVVGRDVTERLRLEEQLRQSQKMDAVGRLAGGVAHDFNNVLSVILSYGEMLLADMKPGDPVRADIEEIHKAGKRATDLTRQLLMFSRQQVLAPRVLDLNDVLTSMDKMLQRILGADVDLVSLPTLPLGRVRADSGNIEQVIMNLVVNARDAMPRGGKLTMETANVVLDEEYARAHLGVKPGPHVMLAVTDTGTGIDKVTVTRIFEPFFTTKESGKGTGLGLSTVFGVVQQSGGSVWVYSEVGKGTTFKVYLPRVDAPVETVGETVPSTTLRGSETILLVEDDDQVRVVAKGILRRSGYHVIDARNAGEALLHSEKHPTTIHLLVSDVVMPQMSGPELAKRLASARPDMKVLCMSGYTDDSIVRHGVLEAHIAYIQKPITPETLTTRVREVLDGGSN
jgi:two-component system, cell cycle sensor histidine kinase and response regulator CckA